MKAPYPFALILAVVCTIPAAAQQPATPQPQQPQPDTQTAPPPPQEQAPPPQQEQSAPPPQAAAPPAAVQLSPITAELTNKLDSKTAKAGDSVVLKTTSNATMSDGTVIPKGSKIVGHVTEAQAHAEDANGRVTLQFDQAQLKSGQSVPITTALQSIAPASGADTGEGGGSASMPSSSPSPSAGGTSGGSTGTGSSGGASASSRPTPSPSAQSPSATPSGGGDQQAGPPPGTAVAQNGNVVIRTTSVPGVLVACSASGRPFSNASGALMSPRQDVHLDGGTKVMLAVASTPAGANR